MFAERTFLVYEDDRVTYAAFDLAVRARDSALLETPLGKLAQEYRFTALHRTAQDGAGRAISPETQLSAGDCLTVITSLKDLQKLMQREAAVD